MQVLTYSVGFFMQTERSVDMLLHGKKPLVEVTFYIYNMYLPDSRCGVFRDTFWWYEQIVT